MATAYVDDIKNANGIQSFAVDSLEFTVDGTTYQIDLDQENKDKFDEVLKIFIEHARIKQDYTPVTRHPIQGYRKSTRPADIRKWCREHNIPISSMGRIPAEIEQQYDETAGYRQPAQSPRKQEKLQTVYKDPVLQPFSASQAK